MSLTAARHYLLTAICLCLTIAIAKSATAQSPDIIRRLPPIDLEPLTTTDLSRIDTALRFTSDPSVYRTPEDVLPSDGPHLTANKTGFFQK